MTFQFSSRDGVCPFCYAFGRKWYIQDRYSGGNCYEHCLMSVSTEPKKTYHFANEKELAEWLLDDVLVFDKDDWYIGYFIRQKTKLDYYDVALVEKDGIEYRLDKAKLTLTELSKHRQETGWFDSYRECLSVAKNILQKLGSVGLS